MSDDELLKRAKDLSDQIESEQQPANNKLMTKLSSLAIWRWFKSIFNIFKYIWNGVLKPITKFINPILLFYYRICKKVYNKLAPNKEGKITKKRHVVTIAGLAIFSMFFWYQMIFNIIPKTAKFTYEAVVINVTKKEAVLMFSQPSTVEGKSETWSVYACRRYPCTGQVDSVEFRINDSVYLDVMRMFSSFEPHDPGELAGAFVSSENACKVQYYGFRLKYFGVYPKIISATCLPAMGEDHETVLKKVIDQQY